MKKNLLNTLAKILTAIVTVAILSLISGIPAYCGLNLDTAAADLTYSHVEDTTICIEPCVEEKDVAAAVSGWELLPEGVCSKLLEYGMNVYLSETTSSTDGINYGGYSYGVKYRYNKNTLAITTITREAYSICKTEGDIEGTVLHEIGHQMDFSIAVLEEGVACVEDGHKISTSQEWQVIYSLYKDQLEGIDSSTKQNMYNSAEGFAECFRLTYQKPEALIAVCPAAYEFVVNVVAKYAP